MKTTMGRNCLILLLGFLGLGALGGGGALVISPGGRLIGMPLSLLKKSPFHDFLIPGTVLFLLLGIAPCLLIFALIRKPACTFAEKLNCYRDMHWSWTFSIYTAFILIAWIQLEMVFLQAVSWLHTFYMVLAIAILFVALLPAVRSLYQKSI
ncbi:MAG: hypothetical protein C0191_03910 [Mucilaginibacter sp.]|nr:hypothetical protein [Mucilaginibacter sp. 44-25]OJW16826.1 MAG: hypothetical protein BGO48_10215 [Mucilaginibacter sp. 44-25]PMP65278.1 MAG: hypothetical protein C0191_03910 [Mucilaginibacter sp.]HEK19620.1 hypothetical protein [Bacteroidota bacterium]